MLEYRVTAQRSNDRESLVACKKAELLIDTSLEGRDDAFNPVELLLAALSGCMLKNIERVSPILRMQVTAVDIQLKAQRQDNPPRVTRIEYQLHVATDADARKIELLHTNLRKYGTVYNTLALSCELTGELHRLDESNPLPTTEES